MFGTAFSVIQVVLGLLQGVKFSAQKSGLTEIEQAISNAISELQKVHGSPVIKGQLDGLAVDATF